MIGMRSAARWIGAAAMLAAFAVVAAPTAVQATEPAACDNLQSRIASVTAVGPGQVAVTGFAQPGANDDPGCERAISTLMPGSGIEWASAMFRGSTSSLDVVNVAVQTDTRVPVVRRAWSWTVRRTRLISPIRSGR